MSNAEQNKVHRPTAPIDWQEVRRRVDAARVAAETGWARDVAEQKRILRTRAQALAAEPKPGLEAGENLEVVEFALACERYGIETSYVREIYPLRELTPVPCTPPFVLGVINVRGEILSVIDLKKFFDLPEEGLTDLNKVIIVHSDRVHLGILADAVLGVRSVPVAALQPTLPTLTGIRSDYLRGITADRLVVLDAGQILSDQRMVVREEVQT